MNKEEFWGMFRNSLYSSCDHHDQCSPLGNHVVIVEAATFLLASRSNVNFAFSSVSPCEINGILLMWWLRIVPKIDGIHRLLWYIKSVSDYWVIYCFRRCVDWSMVFIYQGCWECTYGICSFSFGLCWCDVWEVCGPSTCKCQPGVHFCMLLYGSRLWESQNATRRMLWLYFSLDCSWGWFNV